MDGDSLLERQGLKNIHSLYKKYTDPSFSRYLGKRYKDGSKDRQFSIGRQNPPLLFDLTTKPNESIEFNKLTDEQKAGIIDIHGNPSKVKHFCPFRALNKDHSAIDKLDPMSRRNRNDNITTTKRNLNDVLQELCNHLMKKTWPQYNGENPFIPRLTKAYLKQNNILDYLNCIPDPISLTDIAQKVRNQDYMSIDDMEQDVKRIAENAALYHGSGSVFAELGEDLYNVYHTKVLLFIVFP